MGKVVPARIDGIVAREAPVAVIFRRGPSRHTQLLTWNLETDEVTPGQWITGRVYTRRCDLSPDGKLLIAGITNYSAKFAERLGDELPFYGGWTAISRPPYFSALAVWYGIGAWNGGGLWTNAAEVRVNLSDDADTRLEPPPWLDYQSMNLPMSEDEPIYSMRLELYGWACLQPFQVEITNPGYQDRWDEFYRFSEEPFSPDSLEAMVTLLEESIPKHRITQAGIWEKVFRSGRLRRKEEETEEWQILDSAGDVRRSFRKDRFEPQFLDIDHRGRVVFGDQGCLWAWEGFPDGKPTLIADLNANRFEAIEAPAWAVSREKP